MFLLEWTASDLLMMALAAVVMIGTVLWIVPGAVVQHKSRYSQTEVTAYDAQIPRYFLAAALALTIGGTHTVIKNFPGFWQWLWTAGYGGHLFRDLSNSHIIIVGGGTVLLTGLTWYVLPRWVNRPLYSESLASASLWFTVIGVFGFYCSWLVLGLVEGRMVASGWEYMAAKEAIGGWHRVPTRITSSIMGVGYWTYVLNVVLTVWAGRHVKEKPFGYLTKFALISALALFVGTVQGVFQVLPANADWIHYAGKFGQYVDPISHAHINLVTGMMVSLAGLFIYFSPRLGGQVLGKQEANRLFWTLVPASLLFYFSFLLLGLILGNAGTGYGGIHLPGLVPWLAQWRGTILAFSGTLMLLSFWVYFSTIWRSMKLRLFMQKARAGKPAAFWLLSTFLLIIGTLHGLLQLLPATAQYLTTPEELPNIHAQLNMVGGVLLVLIGVVYLLLPELVGQPMDQRLARITLVGIGGGISSYYIVTLVAGLLRFGYLLQGMDNVQSALHLGWVTPALLMLTSIPMLVGYGAFGLAVLRVTGGYRTTMAQELRQAPARFNGPVPTRLKRMPMVYILGMEAAGSLFGWPGLGWLYAGQAMPGVALLLLGPAVAWALLPMLFSPFTDTALSQWGWVVLLVWLPGSALLSCTLLAFYLHRIRGSASALKPAQPAKLQEVPALEPVVPAKSTMPTKSGTRIPRRMVVGAAILLLFLISVPLVPLLVRVPSEVVAQSLMTELPDRANGAYLEVSNSTQSGLLKLFTWSFALDKVPDSAPLLSTAYFQGIRIRQKGLDDPARYQLFRMEDDQSIAFTVQSIAFQQEMALTPETRLPEGDYLLSIPTGGMFAGREYYYFRLTSAAAPFPQMVAEPAVALPLASASVPVAAPWLTLFPLSSALISLLAAVVMAQRLWLKIRPHEAAWTVAFALFGLAAASQVVGDEWGWTPTLARLYYVCGATLVVGWLGLGTWLLLVRRPWLRSAGLWCTLLLSGYGIGLINMTPINDSLLSTAGWHALDKPLALTILTIGINSVGTVVLVGGALWSAWLFWRRGVMQQRMVGCILLAVGALTVAAGGSLTRLGHQQYLYIAMSSGVLLMFWGYLKTIQSATKPQVPVASPGTLGAVGLR